MLEQLGIDCTVPSAETSSIASGSTVADVVETANRSLRTALKVHPPTYVTALERNLEAATNSIQFLSEALDRCVR